MGLSDLPAAPTIAVSDMAEAKEFYEGRLGLSGGEEKGDGGTTYPCAGDSSIHVYPSPDNAGKSTATLGGWIAGGDIEPVVDELTSNGVTFERFDMDPIKTDEKGIARMGDTQMAWFKDPDGNILAVGSA